jgi:2-succinyl-6-hydroxy-2,4-cyclohexadiene-1-carboxylate synthase
MQLNGLDFHVEIEGQGPPLVLLHGFTGSTRAWADIRPAVVASATMVSIDLIGHGASAKPADPGRYTLEHATNDLLALLDELGLETVDLLGYSMGGRVALHFALRAPQRLNRLILESASPGIELDDERRRRVQSDSELAERIVQAGVEAFVAEWERQPLLAPASHMSNEARQRQHEQRLRNDALGLANSLHGMGAGQQTPLWSRLGELCTPTLLIMGANDSRYRQIGERMLSLMPNAELAVVPAAGHTVHVDQPRAFAKVVSDYRGSSFRDASARSSA